MTGCQGCTSPSTGWPEARGPKEDVEEPLTVMGSGDRSSRVGMPLGMEIQQDFRSAGLQRERLGGATSASRWLA